MSDPVFLWRMEADGETVHTILYGSLVVERAHAAKVPMTTVSAEGYESADYAREVAVEAVDMRQSRGLTLTGMWVVRDADADDGEGGDGDIGWEIRAIHSLAHFGLTEHMEARAVDVIADIQMRGEVLHHA